MPDTKRQGRRNLFGGVAETRLHETADREGYHMGI